MEQKTVKFTDGDVVLECKMTLKEKFNVLFHDKFALKIDNIVGSDVGVTYSKYEPFFTNNN